jgi:hypothetical protein
MNSTSSPYSSLIWSAMSVTGPQTRVWHSLGVAKRSATGLLPTTSAKSFSCMSSGGTRVSIASTSPPAEASVSVDTTGAFSPTAGMRLLRATSIVVGAPRVPWLVFVTTSTA